MSAENHAPKPELTWQAALGELQLQMTQATFDTWLRDSRCLGCEDDTFVIAVRSGYAKDWLENRLLAPVKRTLTRLSGRPTTARFVVWDDASARQEKVNPLQGSHSLQQPQPAPISPMVTPLTQRYSFTHFVVGPGNRLAHAASMAVAESPGSAYNPLFLYGGVGLGKTHLLHAIGLVCQETRLNVVYVSSEEFTNDLIDAIRAHATDDFREKYRTVDVLLVDDVQFIAGKESTQEEFFHTFNTLHSNGKQIVMSSDRPPKAMGTLEERLRSRFEWGLIADIQPPDLETRIAILRTKAEARSQHVPDNVIHLIAARVQSNIRELEGALNRVLALPQLTGMPLTVAVAEAALTDFSPHRVDLEPSQIVDCVANFYSVSVEELMGRSRNRSIARPRQVAMYLLRKETDSSLPQIGLALGGRDHTTVLHGYERIAELVEEDDALRREVLAIRQHLYGNGNGGR